jgi:ParB-like chromosome segregation protein Spo0J
MSERQAIKVASSFKFIEGLEVDAKVAVINYLRAELHKLSPFKDEPVDFVRWVPAEDVQANDYNPNAVAPTEMELLRVSIMADGYTQPIVTNLEESRRVVVDGFHRNRVGKECADVRTRVHGFLPVVQIKETQSGKEDRMAATIRHNRARGKHKVEAMSDIVMELKRRFWSDEKIGKELGMDPDEVLRLAQITGLSTLFSDREFSEAWEAEEFAPENEDDEQDYRGEAIDETEVLSSLADGGIPVSDVADSASQSTQESNPISSRVDA